MDNRGILIAPLLETKLSSRNPLSCSHSYNLIRKDRGINKEGGIAFFIYSLVNFRPLDIRIDSIDDHFERQGICVRSGEVEIEIFNIYFPPVAASSSWYNPSLDFILEGQKESYLAT